MEAMASGCAVVGSKVGGNPELIVDRETGVLFTPGDSEDLAAKIRLLTENRLLRSQVAENAKKLIRGQFSLERSAGCMADIYDEFVSAKISPRL
jgi:glycosyltransferase involved in cell wall biosynthesis